MKKQILLGLVSFILVTSSVMSVPTAARAEEPVLNICVHKKTAVFRSATTQSCLASEWPIGVGALTPGTMRPKKINTYLANRIKVAQLVGKKAGFDIRIRSGWRSLKTQQRIYNQRTTNKSTLDDSTALPPELSMHPWGLAVDLRFTAKKKAGIEWLEANSYQFGLCRRYENEWWHYEPLVAPGEVCPALEVTPVTQ